MTNVGLRSGLFGLVCALALAGVRAHASGVPLSSLGPGLAFQDQDFSVPIRYNFASQTPESSCILDNLLVTGITRLTGIVTCIKHDNAGDECRDGQFAQQLTANLSASPPRLVYSCRNVVKATCPDDYVWKSLDYSKLDPGPPGSPATDCSTVGTCVYRWRNNIPWQRSWPAGQTAVSGTFCNPNVYHATYSSPCQAVNVQKYPGAAYSPCPPCNGHGCSTCSTIVTPPDPTTSYSVSGANAACSLVKSEPNGSYVSASVSWSGTCVINAPEYVAPLTACSP